MRALYIALAGVMLASVPAAARTVEEQGLLHQRAAEMRPEQMRADIEALVGFGTRHATSEAAAAGYESPVVLPDPAGSFVSVGDPAPRPAQ